MIEPKGKFDQVVRLSGTNGGRIELENLHCTRFRNFIECIFYEAVPGVRRRWLG
jgi:hypothetical protein